MLRIGFLTSGGDCQALNAAMRGVFKCICNNAKEPVEFYGFEDGYKGLIYGKFHMLTGQDFKGILTRGGTILGTAWSWAAATDPPRQPIFSARKA